MFSNTHTHMIYAFHYRLVIEISSVHGHSICTGLSNFFAFHVLDCRFIDLKMKVRQTIIEMFSRRTLQESKRIYDYHLLFYLFF